MIAFGSSTGAADRAHVALRSTLTACVAALSLLATTAVAQMPANPILFVTQTPVAGFSSGTSAFGNHLTSIVYLPRGGDLMIRYGDGTLRNLTQEAGYGDASMQGANAIAVREPCVHWSGQKALFSMVVGAPAAQYQVGTWYWQIYEVTGLGQGEEVEIRKVSAQPTGFNNVSPIYATDGRILFTSDRPRSGEMHHYPQRDEYESAPIVAGIYALDESAGTFELLQHSPSGSTSLSLDSFGRVIFTKWDHLQRDQQGDAPATAAAFKAFTYASEDADAAKTTSLTGAEIFPEPRTTNDPAYSSEMSVHSFNHFFPWEMNEDGTAEETLNHMGRQEFGGSYTDGNFPDDDNLSYYTPESYHANTLRIAGSAGLFHLREDPLEPGDFLMTYAPEFGTASGGTLMRLHAAPGINAVSMMLTAVTPTSSDAPVPSSTGYFRNPLPTTDGKLLASHTAATGQATNLGNTASPNWNYTYRIRLLQPSGAFMAAGPALTGSGITKSMSWWTPDALATWSGTMWELDAVEVVARTVPVPRTSELPAVEAGVFSDEGVDVEEFRQYLHDNELALIVSRNVTQRDRGDVQQPFNLSVPGGVSSIAEPGTVYDVTHLQIFQADAVRGYGPLASPNPGRRVLARAMHGPLVSNDAGAPAGGVTIAPDGSIAAFVPARRALTWQLTDDDGAGIVRERNWISFQSGEIRVCANCHGVNTVSQTGDPEPENEPEALRALLQAWIEAGNGGGGGGGGETCESGIVLERAGLKAKATPKRITFQGEAVVPTPWEAVDPATGGIQVVVSGLLDAVLPGGAAWTSKPSGWSYRDDAGTHDGITRIRIRNLSSKQDGRLAIKVKASSAAAITLPSPLGIDAAVVFGAADECATVEWNGPAGAEPRCQGDASKLSCR